MSFTNKKAIVTGAGSGIGKSIALKLAQAGAEVFLFDLNPTALQEVSDSINKNQGKSHVRAVDVSSSADVMAAFNSLNTARVDILINSAGVSHIGKLTTTSEEDFDRLYNVNVKGVFNCMKAAIPLMSKEGGVIINLASIAATVGIPDRFAYSMTKGAVLSMTLSVARDYINEKIRCNCISPARIHTPFVDNFLAKNYPGREKEMFDTLSKSQPIGRMGTPDEVAALALYLSSDEASFITGSDYALDGGFIRLK
jgi:NAD(P)-dependent dehydrogenase (short-subunit alcohol dehydrogenase family)